MNVYENGARSLDNWKRTESNYYVFHYKDKSYAHKNISKIVEEQDYRFKEIINYFPATISRKVDYWLCDSREEVALLADNVPTNGIVSWDDNDVEDVSIYAVYNETMQCTGYHEETHAVTHFINEPSSSALSEGTACFMEKTWWGIDNNLCTYIYYHGDKYVSVENLICDKEQEEEFFCEVKEAIAYPIMGAFVEFLFSKEEQNPGNYLKLYKYEGDDWRKEFENIYHCELHELEKEFLNVINKRKYSKEEIAYGKERLEIV